MGKKRGSDSRAAAWPAGVISYISSPTLAVAVARPKSTSVFQSDLNRLVLEMYVFFCASTVKNSFSISVRDLSEFMACLWRLVGDAPLKRGTGRLAIPPDAASVATISRGGHSEVPSESRILLDSGLVYDSALSIFRVVFFAWSWRKAQFIFFFRPRRRNKLSQVVSVRKPPPVRVCRRTWNIP